MQRNYQLKEVAIPEQPPYPLHESVKDRLSPDYVEFYNHYLLNATPVHHLPVGVARKNSGIPPSHSKPLPGERNSGHFDQQKRNSRPKLADPLLHAVWHSAEIRLATRPLLSWWWLGIWGSRY